MLANCISGINAELPNYYKVKEEIQFDWIIFHLDGLLVFEKFLDLKPMY